MLAAALLHGREEECGGEERRLSQAESKVRAEEEERAAVVLNELASLLVRVDVAEVQVAADKQRPVLILPDGIRRKR